MRELNAKQSKKAANTSKPSKKKLGADGEDNALSNEEEEKRIEELCKEFGVPDPKEIYVIPRDFETTGNPHLTQFSLEMPEGLIRWVDEEDFEYTIGKLKYLKHSGQINSHFARAEKIDCRTVWNGTCKFLTCYLIRACRRTPMERAIIRVRNFVLQQNRDVYHPKGLHVVEPAARGLRHIEIRSITFYSMKYFLEHEDEVSEAELTRPRQSRAPETQPRRSVLSHYQFHQEKTEKPTETS